MSFHFFGNRAVGRRALAILSLLLGLGLGTADAGVAALQRVAGTCESLPGGVIEVEGTGGSGVQPTGYATLGAAFTAINNGVHTGTLVIDVCGNTAEAAATATLNASGVGAASYTTLTISPAGGAARTISGATTAGNPMIDLNGADNVTINGLNTGGNSLTLSNTTVSATAGTSTLRYQADATNNLLTNTTVLGSATMAAGTNGGNIWFGAAAVTTGNDNNTVSNCDIGPAGANLPTKGIYLSGTSNTDPGTANSGITINNNNIFDSFSATVSSAGIDLNSGTVATTISNNRFYQTAPRTMTATGLTHSGIRLSNSSGNAYQITGNTVGFANSAGTGTYGLTFPTTTTGAFIPFNISVNTLTVTNITGNTVAGIAVSGGASGTSTSAPFRAIYVAAGLATASNNTIGSQSATGSITYTSTSASASDVIGIFNFGSNNWTTNNNTIGGITAANSSTGASNVYGLRTNTGSGVTWTCQSNTIGGTVANSIQSTSTATGTTVQGIKNDNPIATITGNTVRNLTAAGGTGTTTAASVIGIVVTTTAANQTISQNAIFNLSNTNTTAATVVTGIQFTGSTANVVSRNLIYGLTAATNSTTAEVNGIRVAGGTTLYRNNMIALGAGIANALGSAATNSGTSGINGINEFLGTDSFFHNSVYIGGSPTAGTGASYAFNGSQTINTRSFRDNIFFNARSNSGATGKSYALKINGTTPNPTGLTLNNNLYFANGAGAVLGFFNSSDVANLAAWKVAVGQDAGSFESNPQYIDPTNATPDLHLHPTLATVAEGNGVDVGVTDDFDGQTRSGLTPVDIGADAGNFVGLDLAPPVISYTPFANTSLTTNRTLGATLTDVTGVATGGLAPRIYYRKNAGAYFSQACSLAGGTTLNGTWNCTVNNADMGGVAPADVISYFVIAQDTLGNLASNPVGAVATNVNSVTTPPAAPNTYAIVAAFAGPINVGTGQTYTSLTNPGGVFEALNAGAFTGDVILNITSDLLAETGTNALNQWPEDGAGGYTLLLRPSGAPRTISGTNAGALIRLNGADRVRFDGSTTAAFAAPPPGNRTVGGTPGLRELTIQNTNTGTSAVVIAVQTGAAGAQNNTFRNLNVLGQDPTTTLAGIALGGATPGTAGIDNDNNRIENCTVKRSIYGIYSSGQSAANPNTGTVITMNDLSATGTDRLRRVGIVVFNEDGVQITENSVGGLDTNESADGVAIGVGTQGLDNAVATAGGVTNALILRNRINGVNSQSTVGFSAAGIAVAGSPGGANLVADNMISGVISPATSPDIVAGIFVAGVAGTSTRVVHNSVAMAGDRGTVATQAPSFALAVTGSNPTVEVKDNALSTTQTSGGGVDAKSYAIGLVTTAFANLDSNYNDFFAGGANAGFFRSGSLAGASGTDYATVAAWGAAVADDANSLQLAPLYVSTTDLHIQPTSPLIAAGTPVAGVTVDFDNETRSATTPAIGADEVLANLSITKTDGLATATPGGSTTYIITAGNAGPSSTTATVADTFPATLTCTWTCAGSGGGTCTPAGSGNINDPVTLPNGASVTYTALCAISLSATGSLANTATVTGLATDPTPGNNSATDTDTVVASSDLSITKTDGVTTATPGGSTTYIITAGNAGPSNASGATVADTFPATLTCTWTCVGAGGGTCTPAGSGNLADTVNLPVGGSVTYTASCSISAAATGSLSNTATVATGGGIDPTPGNNSATDTDTLTASADLSITKTDGVTGATAGGNTTYTITAGNAGPSNTTATVADTFPATLTCTWTCAGAGGGTCTAAGSGNINDPVTLPNGASVTYSAACSISAAATGTLTNTATVIGVATDPTPGNNSATDTDTLGASANLGITKTDGVTTATAGGNTTYTITASNAGPSNTTATVADTFPATLTCTWTCAGAGGGTCTAAGSGNINDPVTLPNGASVTYSAACSISAAATGTLANTATVTGAATDPTPGNNSATDTDTLGASANLGITKTDGVTTATAGGNTTYTITASNAGPSNTTATVADTFPATLTCTWTCAGAGGGTCTAAGSGNINDPVTLPNGASVTYAAACSISAAATGTLTNTATVTGAATDPTPGNNSATDTDTLGASANLGITKTDGVTTATAGGSVTYTIVAGNAGPSAATGATVNDTFPASLTCTWTCAGAGGGTCTAAGSGNLADSANLPVGGSVTYTASCTLSAAATGTLANTATVTAPASVTDPTPGNNSATDSDTIQPPPGATVAGTKTAPAGPYSVGSTITYTITLNNTGTAAQGNNPGNEFTDVLPSTLALVSATAPAVANVGTNTVTFNGTIPAGGSVSFTITATILASAAGSTVSNQGAISFDADGNGTNESTAQTDDPAAAGTANPTSVAVTGGVIVIPTLSSLGLILLAGALAVLALAILKRRQVQVR